jgi:two-component system, chemotaxis family, sensor kinase CheA
MSTVDLAQFHSIFFAESAESLDAAEAALLRIEQNDQDPELLNQIFRAVHSIKGSGGSLGFDVIAGFSHKLEAVLDRLRKREYQPNSSLLDLLLASVDCLRSLLRAAEDKTEPDGGRVAQLQVQLESWQAGPAGSVTAPSVVAVPALETAPAEASQYIVFFRPHPGFFTSGNDPLRLFKSLSELGEFTAQADFSDLPSSADFDPEQCYLAWQIQLTTEATREQIVNAFDWVSECCELLVDPVPAASPPIERVADDAPPAEVKRAEEREATAELRTNNLHVSADKVDQLVNLVSELVITHTILRQIAAGFEMSRLPKLEAAVSLLERHTRDMQHNVLGMRMLPVSVAFGRFGRVVRDVSLQLGKQVQLQISGEESELDKTVIEKLIDPLTHLVRNALDHGIETPEERRLRGKPETAQLSLRAEHKNGNIVIEVRDDGRGINAEKVRAKAVALGLVGAHEELGEEQITRLIFLPGLSTAKEVSDISGRGVGLDVVRRNIAHLGGSMQVVSRQGEGTRFTITLPLTLAIMEGMSVSVGPETYIVPVRFIAECLQPGEAGVRTVVGRGRVVDVRGDYVPLLDLSKLAGPAAAAREPDTFLLLEANGRKAALPVDEILGQDQVVIKSLETHYRKLEYYAGATILGDGKVALILDVNALVSAAPAKQVPTHH